MTDVAMEPTATPRKRGVWNLEPAHSILKRFGGVKEVAFLVNRTPQAVALWAAPRWMKGANGAIPLKYHRLLLEVARLRDIKLRAEDFLPLD